MTRRRPIGATSPTANASDADKLMHLLQALARQAAREAFRALRDPRGTPTVPSGSKCDCSIRSETEGTTSDAGEQIERFFTVAEVADQLGLSEKSVRRKIAKGELPAVRFGRLLRVGERDRDAYIAASHLRMQR